MVGRILGLQALTTNTIQQTAPLLSFASRAASRTSAATLVHQQRQSAMTQHYCMIFVSNGNGNSSESKSKQRKSNQAVKSIHTTKTAARMHACRSSSSSSRTNERPPRKAYKQASTYVSQQREHQTQAAVEGRREPTTTARSANAKRC